MLAESRVVRAEEYQTVLVQRTLRSGQSVYYPGNVVVLGDVNPGAQVAATGDVIVIGALRGTVHAGAGGNEKAMVIAFRFEPTQLRIAGHISRPPEGMVSAGQPEVARIKEGVVTIDPFLTAGERQTSSLRIPKSPDDDHEEES
ncbi:MAG: septum site-determining protein MinC [Bacillota bacterium]